MSGQPTIDNIAACIAFSHRGSDPIRHGSAGRALVTDPVGSDAANDKLGTNRANSVRDALRTALRGHGIADADVVINVETRGERDLLAKRSRAQPARRDLLACLHAGTVAAAIEVVLDDNNDTIVDAAAPVTTFVRFGLGYDGAGNVRNGQAETANFVGQDRRRFYLRAIRQRRPSG